MFYNVLFRTTFSLTGYDPTTALVNASMSADNDIVGVFLNGVSLGRTHFNWQTTANFTISSGFQSGINTLDFYAADGGPPASFEAELNGRATPVSATPEPASLTLFATGLIGMVGVARRRQRSAVV